MSPAVASSRPAINRSAVLLPQPDGPTSTRNSLSWIWIVRSLTARTSPNTLLTWSRVTPAIGNSSTRNMSRATVDGRAPVVAPPERQRRARSIAQTPVPVQPFSRSAPPPVPRPSYHGAPPFGPPHGPRARERGSQTRRLLSPSEGGGILQPSAAPASLPDPARPPCSPRRADGGS